MSELSPRLIAKLQNYQPSLEASKILSKIPVVFLVGISGAGKDTIKHELFTRYPKEYHHVVSHTTRLPRKNRGVMEQDGVEYHFIDETIVERMIDNQAFIEAKQYGENIYGTSIAEFLMAEEEGRIALTDLEVQGVVEYVRLAPSVKPIFILPPSYEVWQERLKRRYGGDFTSQSEDIKKRMQTAKEELITALEVDYFWFVVNDTLSEAVEQIHAIAMGDSTRQANEFAKQVAKNILSQLQQEVS